MDTIPREIHIEIIRALVPRDGLHMDYSALGALAQCNRYYCALVGFNSFINKKYQHLCDFHKAQHISVDEFHLRRQIHAINTFEAFKCILQHESPKINKLVDEQLLTYAILLKYPHMNRRPTDVVYSTICMNVHQLVDLIDRDVISRGARFSCGVATSIKPEQLLKHGLKPSHDPRKMRPGDCKYLSKPFQIFEFMSVGDIREDDLISPSAVTTIGWDYTYLVLNKGLSPQFLLKYRDKIGAPKYDPNEMRRFCNEDDITVRKSYTDELLSVMKSCNYDHDNYYDQCANSGVNCVAFRHRASKYIDIDVIFANMTLKWSWFVVANTRHNNTTVGQAAPYEILQNCWKNTERQIITFLPNDHTIFMEPYLSLQLMYENGALDIETVRSNFHLNSDDTNNVQGNQCEWNIMLLAQYEGIHIRDFLKFHAEFYSGVDVGRYISRRADVDLEVILDYPDANWNSNISIYKNKMTAPLTKLFKLLTK